MREAGITSAQCRAARAAVGWKQEELAEKAEVSRPVVQDFEGRGRVPITNNLRAIRAALEAGGVVFQWNETGRAGITFADEDASE